MKSLSATVRDTKLRFNITWLHNMDTLPTFVRNSPAAQIHVRPRGLVAIAGLVGRDRVAAGLILAEMGLGCGCVEDTLTSAENVFVRVPCFPSFQDGGLSGDHHLYPLSFYCLLLLLYALY